MILNLMLMYFFFQGFQKHCDVTFCNCIPDGIILIKNGLWPVSPTAPTVALQLELMAHLKSLFLEAQLSLNSFCNSIRWKQVFSGRPAIVSDLYNSLSSNDTFEQYRQFIYNIRFLRTLCPDATNGTECPACPKESGITFWNFDACFGLFRKKSAGKHPLPSVHGPLYFEEQDMVDEFLSSYKISRKETELENEKECSQFQAGGDFDVIHCKGKNNLFDEKAVFGCVCRHEYPLRFLDIKHGERFGYIIYLLEQLLELDRSKPIQRKVVYDIGCKLHRHVELTNNEKILGKVAFMLPAFHAFAHSTPCQMKYSIFYQEGSGFSNGEQCERLWSYLRCFSSMTREMTAAHRQDALTDALLYYSRKILMKTGFLTVNRLTRAKDALTASSAELQKLLVDLQADKEQVLVWEKQLLHMSENRRKGQSGVHVVSWQMKYIRMLLLHRQLSDDLANCADSVENATVAPVLNKLRRIDKQLKQVEEKNNVRRRWKIDQPTVYEFVEAVEDEERREVIEKLRAVAFDRWFLLSLKRKYSTGQKIAKILTRSINVKVTNMKEILRNYNRRSAIKMNLVPEKVTKIEYNDAVDIQSAIYQGLPSFEGDEIPSDIKRKAVELSVMNRRAAEEIDLCRQDMICTINHLITEKKKILLAAEYHASNPVSSRYSRGAVSLLNQKIIQLDGMISCYGKTFVDAGGITQGEIDSFSLQRVVLLDIPFPITTSQLEDLSDDETEAAVEAESDDCDTQLHDDIILDNSFLLFLSEDSD